MKKHHRYLGFVIIAALSLAVIGCTAGDPRFAADDPAGFWAGLWHGIISVITLIIGIFSDTIKVYEVNNSGGWYNFGFLAGVICCWGGGFGSGINIRYKGKKQRHKKEPQAEWEDIGEKVEKKIMRKIKEWAESDEGDEWDEIGKKVEEKLKKKIREWAEKE